MAKWRAPGLGSSEGKFLDLIAASPKDFAEFIRITFPVPRTGTKPYTARRRTIDGTDWLLCNDPCLNGGNVLGMRIDGEAEETIKALLKEGRIKVLEG